MLHPGSAAPLALHVKNTAGDEVSLRDFLGLWVVVYFYPKDATPGCTVEAEGFRDHAPAFAELNTIVLGVSRDSCESHQRFTQKKNLNFMLLADTDHKLMSAFGTWGKREFMGRSYLGTSRTTFLLDPEGAVAAVWESVKPSGHAQEVLGRVRDLQAARAGTRKEQG